MICELDPVGAKEGEILAMVGRGLGVMVGEGAAPPPPHPVRTPHINASDPTESNSASPATGRDDRLFVPFVVS